MLLHDSPVYRKVIIPWYDSDPACRVIIAFMAMVFLFGLVGISIAHGTVAYRIYIWVPVLLVLLSLGTCVSTAVRLTTRNSSR